MGLMWGMKLAFLTRQTIYSTRIQPHTELAIRTIAVHPPRPRCRGAVPHICPQLADVGLLISLHVTLQQFRSSSAPPVSGPSRLGFHLSRSRPRSVVPKNTHICQTRADVGHRSGGKVQMRAASPLESRPRPFYWSALMVLSKPLVNCGDNSIFSSRKPHIQIFQR